LIGPTALLLEVLQAPQAVRREDEDRDGDDGDDERRERQGALDEEHSRTHAKSRGWPRPTLPEHTRPGPEIGLAKKADPETPKSG
jgi:hypothetical protein